MSYLKLGTPDCATIPWSSSADFGRSLEWNKLQLWPSTTMLRMEPQNLPIESMSCSHILEQH